MQTGNCFDKEACLPTLDSSAAEEFQLIVYDSQQVLEHVVLTKSPSGS